MVERYHTLYCATGLSTFPNTDCIPMFDGIATLRLSTSLIRLGYFECSIVVDTSLPDYACSLSYTGVTITGFVCNDC